MGAGYHGGFGNTKGSKKQDKRESNSQSLPKNDAQIKHIFSWKEGHLEDTPSNRKVLTDLANNKEKFIGTDKYGNSWNAEWDENKDEELGKFLSSANPFQFKDIGSADPLIYEEFCGKVPDIITLDDSYECARNYVNALGIEEVQTAFLTVNKEEWDECLKEYLSQEHKGDKSND